MDKIYSRARIKLPKINGFRFKEGNLKPKRVGRVCAVFLIAIIIAFLVIHELNPIFNAICTEKSKAIATEIINVESSKVFTDIDYEDLVDIVEDVNGNIRMLRVNTVLINTLASDIAYNIQQKLYKTENSSIFLPIRDNFWKQIFSRFWPQNSNKDPTSGKCNNRI